MQRVVKKIIVRAFVYIVLCFAVALIMMFISGSPLVLVGFAAGVLCGIAFANSKTVIRVVNDPHFVSLCIMVHKKYNGEDA